MFFGGHFSEIHGGFLWFFYDAWVVTYKCFKMEGGGGYLFCFLGWGSRDGRSFFVGVIYPISGVSEIYINFI